MSKGYIKKAINKKLKDKWGYSKREIEVYWQVNKDLTIEELKIELEKI